MEPSVVEQADAGAVAVCIGAGADGADGEEERVAGTLEEQGACDSVVVAFEVECGAQAWEHGPMRGRAVLL